MVSQEPGVPGLCGPPPRHLRKTEKVAMTVTSIDDAFFPSAIAPGGGAPAVPRTGAGIPARPAGPHRGRHADQPRLLFDVGPTPLTGWGWGWGVTPAPKGFPQINGVWFEGMSAAPCGSKTSRIRPAGSLRRIEEDEDDEVRRPMPSAIPLFS